MGLWKKVKSWIKNKRGHVGISHHTGTVSFDEIKGGDIFKMPDEDLQRHLDARIRGEGITQSIREDEIRLTREDSLRYMSGLHWEANPSFPYKKKKDDDGIKWNNE